LSADSDDTEGSTPINKAVERYSDPTMSEPVSINPKYQNVFDLDELTSFDSYLNQIGEAVKSEHRTHIRKVTYQGTAFAIKVYRYPQLTAFRTWHATSKAQREYQALVRCESLNINALKPVGYSVSRNRLGFVKECCLMTKWEDNKITFKEWLTNVYQKHPEQNAGQLHDFLFEIGRQLKILHENHFFLLTPFAKNILIRSDNHRAPENPQEHAVRDRVVAQQLPKEYCSTAALFLDMPYARELLPQPAASWGQLKDLGAVLASTRKHVDENTFKSFYEGYGQDPFPQTNRSIQDKATQGQRVHLKQTPFQFTVRLLRRGRWGKSSFESN
jgi:hypothetical protein